MKKKVALVIGGNGGIGSSIVEQLLADGFFVCTTFFQNKDQIQRIQNEQDNLKAYRCDVNDSDIVKNVIDSIITEFGVIDIVVFSVASNYKNNLILNLNWDEISDHFNLQIKSMFLVIQAMSEQIKLKYKTKFIVILSEVCKGQPPNGFSAYVTSKYAAMGMAKTMALELARYNCRVNMVSPGLVETNLLSEIPKKMIEIAAINNPLKQNTLASDVAKTVSFLASKDADFLNGTNIPVNGGNVLF